jgi:GAF domain-containing protein
MSNKSSGQPPGENSRRKNREAVRTRSTRRVAELKARAAALEEEVHVLQVLNRTGEVLSSELSLDRLVQAVTDAGVELSGAEFGAFFYNVTDQSGEAYLLHALSGAPREPFAQFPNPRNTAVFRPTFEGEGPVCSDDITADPRFGQNAPYYGMPPGHLPVRSYLAVPVVSRSGDVLGGLFFGHSQTGVFTIRAERLLAAVAAQAATAIDNAHLMRPASESLPHDVQQRSNFSGLTKPLSS